MNINYSAREVFMAAFFACLALTYFGVLTVPAVIMGVICLVLFILIVLKR